MRVEYFNAAGKETIRILPETEFERCFINSIRNRTLFDKEITPRIDLRGDHDLPKSMDIILELDTPNAIRRYNDHEQTTI